MLSKPTLRVFQTCFLLILGIVLSSSYAQAQPPTPPLQAPTWVKKTLVTESAPNVITKIGGNTWISGAVTGNVLLNGAPGKIRYVNEQASMFKNFGLGEYPEHQDYAYQQYAAGWRIIQDGRAATIFGGVQDLTNAITNIQVNDVFEVERVGDTIHWIRNGTIHRSETYTGVEDWRGIIGLYTNSSVNTQMSGVQVDFSTQALSINADIVPAALDGSTSGQISLNVSGGTAPYTYNWQNVASTSSSVSNLAAGDYTLAITDAVGQSTLKTYSVGYAAAWHNDVRVDEVNIAEVKSTNNTGWNSGISTRNTLLQDQDGWMEFELGGGVLIDIGMSLHPELSLATNEHLFSLRINNHNTAVIMRNGSRQQDLALGSNSRIRISREGSYAKFYVNGAECYSLFVNSHQQLISDITFYLNNTSVKELTFSSNILVHDFLPSVVAPSDPITSNGSIAVQVDGGTGGNTFSWDNIPSASSDRSGLTADSYLLNVSSGDGQYTDLPVLDAFKTKWAGGTNHTVDASGTFRKQVGTPGYGSVYSEQRLPANTDGSIEYVVEDDLYLKTFGFRAPSAANYSLNTTIAGFYMTADGVMHLIQNGGQAPLQAYDKHDVLRVTREGSEFKFYKNGLYLSSITADPALELECMFATASTNTVVTQVITSFSEGIDFALGNVYYGKLVKELDASFYVAEDNQLRFVYEEEYNPTQTTLKYKIYDEFDNAVAVSSQTNGLAVNYGENFISLDLGPDGFNLTRSYYILEVENEKQEKWYLRFFPTEIAVAGQDPNDDRNNP